MLSSNCLKKSLNDQKMRPSKNYVPLVPISLVVASKKRAENSKKLFKPTPEQVENVNWVLLSRVSILFLFNLDSLHARLNSNYDA